MSKYGHYIVGDKIITNTMHAFLEASKNKSTIKWYYHDDIFRALDKSMLGKISLQELYRRRAQQLRDSYDYLILQYSGGSDSHCILNTFLKNNIKLDQVMVKMPFKMLDQGIHNPNYYDRDPANYYSEWDYVIKQDLAYLAKYHPEIDIKLIDWLENISKNSFNDSSFQSHRGLYFMSYILKHPEYSTNETEIKLLDKGKRVGVINGVEKPMVFANKDGLVYATFTDKPIALIPPTVNNPNGTEYFFWTPDMPELAMEQAYQVFLWFKQHPGYKNILYRHNVAGNIWKGRGIWPGTPSGRWGFYSELVKQIIYPDWNPARFQVTKSNHGALSDMSEFDKIIETHPAIIEIKEGWKYYWKSYLNQFDTDHVVSSFWNTQAKILPNGQFPQIDSSHYLIGDLNEH